MPHFFLTKKMIQSYNDMILQDTTDYKITFTALDILPADISSKFREQLHAAVCKWKTGLQVVYQDKLSCCESLV